MYHEFVFVVNLLCIRFNHDIAVYQDSENDSGRECPVGQDVQSYPSNWMEGWETEQSVVRAESIETSSFGNDHESQLIIVIGVDVTNRGASHL